VEVVVRDTHGKRVVRDVALLEGNKVIATGKTYDDTRDLNSHFSFTAPEGTVGRIEVKRADGTPGEVREVTFTQGKAHSILFSAD
jgi:hypothetical protein